MDYHEWKEWLEKMLQRSLEYFEGNMPDQYDTWVEEMLGDIRTDEEKTKELWEEYMRGSIEGEDKPYEDEGGNVTYGL